jgi:hypothetical protein
MMINRPSLPGKAFAGAAIPDHDHAPENARAVPDKQRRFSDTEASPYPT